MRSTKNEGSRNTQGTISSFFVEIALDFLINIEPAPLGVSISSDIEPSWKKWTGAASALGDAYKKRDAAGHVTSEIDPAKAVQVAGAGTPDTLDDVWKLMCLRAGNGKMTVESAADWVKSSDPSLSFEKWLGGSRFTANVIGLSFPTYMWTEPANSHYQNDRVQTPNVDDLSPAPPTLATSYYGILLGSQPDGSDLTKSSTIKVKAQDNLGTLEDNYSVNWHLPIEGIEEYGRQALPYGLLPAEPRNGQLKVVPPNQSTQVILNPSTAQAKVYLSSGEQLTVAVGKAILTRGATVFLGKAKPVTPRAAALAMLGWFYTLEMSDAVSAPEYATIDNTEAECQRAVTSTRDALNKVAGADARVTPSDIAWEEHSITRWLGCTMTPWIKSTTVVTFTRGDEYNANGYVGRVLGEVYGDEKVEVVGHYQYDGVSPTMR